MHDPTTLPDTGSVNKFAHNYSVFQTRVLQKLGKLEKSLDYTPEFRTLNERAKDFVICYDDIARTARRFFGTFKIVADAEAQHAELLQRFATDVQKEHEALSAELRRMGENNKHFAQLRIAWERDGNEAFSVQLERFLKEVAVARKAKDDFRESRIELDAVETKLRSLQAQKSPDISALYLQQTQVSACRQKFENCWTDAFTKLSDVDTKRDLDLLLLFIAFVEAQQKHWQSMLSIVAELESVANMALQQAYALRMSDEARREKRAMDKAAAVAEADRTKWNALLSLLSNKDLVLFSAIASATEGDEVLELIVKVLEQQSIIFPIIFDQISREVTKTDSVAILFRGNTISTKIMMNYVRFSGKQYLSSTLSPLLQEIIELGDTIEVDPNKLRKGADLTENMVRYRKVCKRCLDAITSSLPAAPRSFREVARYLNTEVNKKFPNSKYQGVAGMVFLRFFCPGLSAPDSYALVDSKQLQADNRRALILVSKVLQNCANNVLFSQKEPYMQEMNSFVEEHIPIVNKFFADFMDVDAQAATAATSAFDPNTSKECQDIYRFIVAHLEPIGKNLVSNNQEAMVSTLAEALVSIWAYMPEAEVHLGAAYRRAGYMSSLRKSSDRDLSRASLASSGGTTLSAARASLAGSGGAGTPPTVGTPPTPVALRSPSPIPGSGGSAPLSSTPPVPPPRTSPPRVPSPRPASQQTFVKPTPPPPGGFSRPISPRPGPPPAAPGSDLPPSSPASATAISLSTLLPSPATAPPSPPDPVSPRGPSLPGGSPARPRSDQRHPSPITPMPPQPPPVAGIIVPLQHAARQPSPSPRALQPSPVREANDGPRAEPATPVSASSEAT